jgi:hypothetical protein
MFVNLTPHTLTIHLSEGKVLKLAPSGEVARVATVETPAEPVEGVPTVRTAYGQVTGLPSSKVGTTLIVSGMVATASPRADVMSPGPLVRDDTGRPVGCRGLRRSL